MGFFDKMKEPVFLKDDSDAIKQLEALQELKKTVSKEKLPRLEQEIKAVNAGIFGEDSVAYELRNSHIPMFVLRDLHFEHDGLSTQIDFLLITRRRNYVIECKNLYGNIEITANGDFLRSVYNNGKFFKKRIYSPIAQNQRHIELIKQIRLSESTNFLTKTIFEKNFNQNYRGIVVLANHEQVLNTEDAGPEIRDQVIYADQLAQYIKRCNAEFNNGDHSDKEMQELANFFLNLHKPNPVDYTAKFSDTDSEPDISEPPAPIAVVEKKESETSAADQISEPMACPKCGAPMVKRTATKGDNKGKKFYGCSAYPKCRSIINI